MEGTSMFDLNGQVAVVTGAGRGLGRHYALGLAARGASVVVNDLGCDIHGVGSDRSVADGVVEEIRSAGGRAAASYDSVGTPEGGQAIVDMALAEFGQLDSVVCNAGLFGMAPFEDIGVETWRQMINVHVDGSFFVSQPAYKVMKAQGRGGRLVFVTSNSTFGIPNATHYATAKAAIIGLTHNIAYEGARHGILANAILPVGITRMARMMGEPEEGTVLAHCAPELVAPMVVFLASRSCQFTHRLFSATGGRYARAFLALAEGWHTALDTVPSDEELMAKLDTITSVEPYLVPESLVDEFELVARLMGIGA
jgi:NAD(P)-dependent dehydrogenase (short-subunit alcohol dehydrogenase family)